MLKEKILKYVFLIFKIYVYGCFACLNAYVPHSCLVTKEARRGN